MELRWHVVGVLDDSKEVWGIGNMLAEDKKPLGSISS